MKTDSNIYINIELKKPNIIVDIENPFDNFNKILTQSVHRCPLSKTPFGCISDSNHTILYQIDIDINKDIKVEDFPIRIDNKNKCFKILPIKYVILNNQCLLLYFILFIRKSIKFFETDSCRYFIPTLCLYYPDYYHTS